MRIGLSLLFLLLLTACGSGKSALQSRSGLTLATALSQLEALPVPAGADAAQFARLRSALRGQLLGSGIQRWPSAVPADAANRVADLYLTRVDDTTATAHWTYRNVGDYDLNGLVTISDLTPLGAHLSKTSAAPDWNVARAADGDANGQVNISDLTPLGSHLQNVVSGYIIEASTTPAVESSWQQVASADFDDSLPGNGQRSFAAEVPAVAGQSFRVVALGDSERGVIGVPYAYDGTGGPPPLSWEERSAVIDAIGAKFADLHTATSDEQDAELAAFIAAQPQIIASGVFTGGAWGRFSDGRLTVALKNRAETDGGTSSLKAMSAEAALQPRWASFAQPQSDKALILNGFTAHDKHETAGTQLAAMLGKQGYDAELRDASLLEVGAIDGPGIVHFDGHGHGIPELGLFLLVTSTVVSPELDAQFAEQLDRLELVSVTANEKGGSAVQHRYGVTAAFVRSSGLTLAPDSLVVLNVCDGGSAAAGEFREALFEAGAGVILGWDKPVSDFRANRAALQFFDDVLGLEDGPHAHDPPQRPFGYDDVIDTLRSRNVAAAVVEPKFPAKLQRFISLGVDTDDGTGQLAPTLRAVVPQPAQSAVSALLHGGFGAQPGKVFVGGSEVTVVEWQHQQIGVSLPNSGPGAFGEVVVENNLGARSNPVMLGEWWLPLHYTETLTDESLAGSVTFALDLNLHLRASPLLTRTYADDPAPTTYNWSTACAVLSDSAGSYSASGALSDDDGLYFAMAPSGAGTLDFDPNVSEAEVAGFYAWATLDAASGGFELDFFAKCPMTFQPSGDHGLFPTAIPASQGFIEGAPGFLIPTLGGPQFDITAGSWSGFYNNESAPIDHQYDLSCEPAANQHPPDPDAPR